MTGIATWRAALLLVLPAAILLPGPALACKCVAFQSTAHAYEVADVVFSGEVIALQNPDSRDSFLENATLRIEKVWKGGPEGSTIEILTPAHAVACGFPFETGESYVIFGFDTGEFLTTNSCSGTLSISQASQEINELDKILKKEQQSTGASSAAD